MLSTGKPWPPCPLWQKVTIPWIFQTYYSIAEVQPSADAREAYFVIWQGSMLSHLISKMQDRNLWTCDKVDIFGTMSNKPNLHYSRNRLNLVNAVQITNLFCSHPPPWLKYWILNTVLCTHEPSSFVIIEWYTQIQSTHLTLYLLMWRIWWAPDNASRWQMEFNLAFKGLNIC